MPLTSIIDVARGMRRRLAGKPRQGVELSVPFVHLGTEYGGYGVALERLSPGAVVYSFGLGEDISFDLALMQRLDCKVFGFDPTPRSIAWVKAQNPPPALQVRELGVADYDGVASFAPPKNPEHISHSLLDGAGADSGARVEFQVRRLATLMAELGHTSLDLLKMDVEGAEYGVLEDMLRSSLRPPQILLEFHHGMHGIPVSRTEGALASLQTAGYRIFDAQPSGREFSLMLSERT
ncbi:MAG: FkbM family methyltransferase [Myxococcales bacterium]